VIGSVRCGMSNTVPGMQPPPDVSGPFRGSSAVASGLLTRGVLRGHRYRRLFPDVYVPAALEVDLALRARAARRARGRARRGQPPLARDRVRRERLAPDETQVVGGTPVTTSGRAAYDLARWAPTLTERVAAVDALAFRCGVTPADVVVLRRRHLGAHGGGDVAEVLALVDPRAESPMESRIRVALVLGGLPPEVQRPVIARGCRYRLDLAYPRQRVAVEYDGADHRGQRRARLDLVREAALTAAGWRVLRFAADEVLFRPDRLVATVRTELGR